MGRHAAEQGHAAAFDTPLWGAVGKGDVRGAVCVEAGAATQADVV